jgi:hypothetical protein
MVGVAGRREATQAAGDQGCAAKDCDLADHAEDSGAMKFALGVLCGAVLTAVAFMLWVV